MGRVPARELAGQASRRCSMNLAGGLRVAARGSALPVSDRKLGSANGNRTRLSPVQFGRSRYKCLHIRSVGTARLAPNPPRMFDVVTLSSLAGNNPRPDSLDR